MSLQQTMVARRPLRSGGTEEGATASHAAPPRGTAARLRAIRAAAAGAAMVALAEHSGALFGGNGGIRGESGEESARHRHRDSHAGRDPLVTPARAYDSQAFKATEDQMNRVWNIPNCDDITTAAMQRGGFREATLPWGEAREEMLAAGEYPKNVPVVLNMMAHATAQLQDRPGFAEQQEYERQHGVVFAAEVSTLEIGC